MPYQPLPKPERQLLHHLWTLSRLLFRTADKESGIAVLQEMILRHVGRFPGTSPGTVAADLRLPPSVVAGTLVELERQRLVRRAPHPRDGRRAMLGLTSRGRAVLDAEAAGMEDRLRAALAGCAPDDRNGFQRVMQRLVEALDSAPTREPEPAAAALSRPFRRPKQSKAD